MGRPLRSLLMGLVESTLDSGQHRTLQHARPRAVGLERPSRDQADSSARTDISAGGQTVRAHGASISNITHRGPSPNCKKRLTDGVIRDRPRVHPREPK